jgi:hypothetical protein
MKTHTPTNSVFSEEIDSEESDNETIIGSENSYYRLFI